MRAIITGGAGFIGSYLSEELVRRGYEISIWDNLFRGKLDNISHLINDENKFYNLDLADEKNIDKMTDLIIEDKPRYIFHYAAINGTQYFYDMPARVLEENASATHNLMVALRNARRIDNELNIKIIYASSSEVYGEPFSLPTKESDITYVVSSHIRDSYAAAKLIGEFYVKLISEEIGIDWINLRLFNVYGPRMVGTKYGQVVPEFIERLKSGEYPLRIFGDGKHKRSFIYVTDNVRDTIDLAESKERNDTYNVGNDIETSILELAESIMKKMKLIPKIEFLTEREGDHKRRCPDTTKIHKVIGNREYIPLETGIDIMLNEME